MCEITVPVNHYDVITFHWKSSANPRWNYTGNERILRGSAAIRGGIKIFRGGIIGGQVSGIAGGLREIVRGGGRAGENPPGLYCMKSSDVIVLKNGVRVANCISACQ